MNHDKMEYYIQICSMISYSLQELFKAQDSLVSLMCKECNVPFDIKNNILENMEKTMGIKRTISFFNPYE